MLTWKLNFENHFCKTWVLKCIILFSFSYFHEVGREIICSSKWRGSKAACLQTVYVLVLNKAEAWLKSIVVFWGNELQMRSMILNLYDTNLPVFVTLCWITQFPMCICREGTYLNNPKLVVSWNIISGWWIKVNDEPLKCAALNISGRKEEDPEKSWGSEILKNW